MNTQIYEEASDWIVKNREGHLDAREKRRFDAWLRESPQNLRAYLEMSAIWEDVASIDPGLNASAQELIARAREEENIIPLESPSALRTPGPPETRRKGKIPALGRNSLYYGLAASFLLTFTCIWLYGQRNTYSTGVGEQRSIVLDDDSTVELNSRSRVRVRFSDAERDIDLIEGQALFHVAKNPRRPFVVSADGTHIRAVGTQFDVYQKSSGTVVTVVEGKVAVFGEPHPGSLASHAVKGDAAIPFSSQNPNASTLPLQITGERRAPRSESGEALAPDDSANGAIFLAAGEQVTVTHASTLTSSPKKANVAAATAWTRRSLVFDSAPLTEVAQEFNRYNTRPLVIVGPQLAEFRVSGVFSSLEPSLLLRFLRAQPELAVETTEREIRISKK
jgi:transmembrane sensor